MAAAALGICNPARAEEWTARKTPTYSSNHIISSGTKTEASRTSYVSSLVVTVTNPGTNWTLQIKDKDATRAKMLYLSAGPVAVGTTTIAFAIPVLMTDGIDIVTSGTAGVMDVFITYWQ